MELLQAYHEARQALLEYFECSIDYGYSFNNCTMFYWWIDPNNLGIIRFDTEPPTHISRDSKYEETIVTIYDGPAYTLVKCLDQGIGDYVLLIFDNTKRFHR